MRHGEFLQLHVVTKNVHSVTETLRSEDFLAELDCLEYDILFSTETWRSAREEKLTSPKGDLMFFNGGTSSRGVGICISRDFKEHLSKISISSRLGILRFTMAGRVFHMFACYFPTAWDPDAEVEELYELISLFHDNQHSAHAAFFFGGDFNAGIGALQPQDDSNSASSD